MMQGHSKVEQSQEENPLSKKSVPSLLYGIRAHESLKYTRNEHEPFIAIRDGQKQHRHIMVSGHMCLLCYILAHPCNFTTL